MIPIESVIKGAAHPEQLEEEYLSTFASLPYEEQIEIYQTSWQRISAWFCSEVRTRREVMVLEFAFVAAPFIQEECNRIHHTVVRELLDRMELIPTVDDLNELNERLLHGYDR